MWISRRSRTTPRPTAARCAPVQWRAALVASAGWLAAVAACDPGEGKRGLSSTDTARGSIDAAPADTSTPRAGTERPRALDYVITEERYQRWVAAQRVLDTLPNLPPPPGLDPDRVTEADIARAAAYLERDPRIQAAFRRAGLDAREYVMTTIALDQALVMTSRPAKSRVRGVPRGNIDLVAERRQDIEGLQRTARYRITEPTADTLRTADTAAGAGGDTAAARGDSSAAAPGAAARVIAAGTTIDLRTEARVCTNTHKAGDRITAIVTTSAAGANGAAIPAGATATLTVTGFKPGGQASDSTVIDFRMSAIAFGGQVYAVEGAVASARAERAGRRPRVRDSQQMADTTRGAAGSASGYQGCVPRGTRLLVTLRNPLQVRA